jgi:glucose 1-dehydrogenase
MLKYKVEYDFGQFSIINFSSVHQTTPLPLAVPYAASKGGVQMLTKTLALEVADKGI